MSNRKTKIITTIGPSSQSKEKIKQLILSGVSTFRCNFSHGDHEEQLNKINIIKKVSVEVGIPVTLLLDTKGPEIRTHSFNGKVKIEKDSLLKVYFKKEIMGNNKEFSVTYRNICNNISVEHDLLLDDGKLTLKCEKVTNDYLVVKAMNTHIVSSKRSINIPDSPLLIEFLSDKDKKDILFGIKHNFDVIATSFVRNKKDVNDLRSFLDANSDRKIKIMSKIECRSALDNLDEIIDGSDAIMIARGDLGIEIPFYEVPYWEKEIIGRVSKTNKPIIVATQMLESMCSNNVPTRAEVMDVYCASYFGADATMLSGESANGDYPIESTKTMSKIIWKENIDNPNKKLFIESKNNLSDDAKKYDAIVFTDEYHEDIPKIAALKTNCYVIIMKSKIDHFAHNKYGYYYGVYYNLTYKLNETDEEIANSMEKFYGIKIDHNKLKRVY